MNVYEECIYLEDANDDPYKCDDPVMFYDQCYYQGTSEVKDVLENSLLFSMYAKDLHKHLLAHVADKKPTLCGSCIDLYQENCRLFSLLFFVIDYKDEPIYDRAFYETAGIDYNKTRYLSDKPCTTN